MDVYPREAKPKPPRELLLKAKVGPFLLAVKLRKTSFYFWNGQHRLSSQMRGRLYCFCFQARRWWKKPCWCVSHQCLPEQRGVQSGGARQLGLQAVYRAPGVNLDSSALCDFLFSHNKNICGHESLSKARLYRGKCKTRKIPLAKKSLQFDFWVFFKYRPVSSLIFQHLTDHHHLLILSEGVFSTSDCKVLQCCSS